MWICDPCLLPLEAPNGLRSRTSPVGCGAGVGVDFAWEQKKLEARKMFGNEAESPASSARFVGRQIHSSISPHVMFTIYSCLLRMDINSTINSAENIGAKNANIAGPANISGLWYGNTGDNKLGILMMNRRVRAKPVIPQSQVCFHLPFANLAAKKPT